jgi:hypothetical protein
VFESSNIISSRLGGSAGLCKLIVQRCLVSVELAVPSGMVSARGGKSTTLPIPRKDSEASSRRCWHQSAPGEWRTRREMDWWRTRGHGGRYCMTELDWSRAPFVQPKLSSRSKWMRSSQNMVIVTDCASCCRGCYLCQHVPRADWLNIL